MKPVMTSITDIKEDHSYTDPNEVGYGHYMNRCFDCSTVFLGHKRIRICKKCNQSTTESNNEA